MGTATGPAKRAHRVAKRGVRGTMRRWRVFSALAALSGALLLLYGFDLGYPMAQFCFSAPLEDSVIGREPIDCFAANPMWAFNPMLWILVDSGICVLVAVGAHLLGCSARAPGAGARGSRC